ncbi:MAG: PLP-dependent aminotransferase family protein [Planctomycetota bacterium]|nr:MAG: PLP-dependent aminotransferase family protein [Planctomycetota bacterium]
MKGPLSSDFEYHYSVPKHPGDSPFTLLPPLAGSGPAQLRLASALREAVLAGRLAAGVRLPSTRALARQLRLSRNTVVAVFEQLQAEGYLRSRVGDGSYVALPPAAPRPPARRATAGRRPLSERGRGIARLPRGAVPVPGRPFAVGMPALDHFPLALWNRVLARCARRAGAGLLGYGAAAGHPALRRAIATHLAAARGLRCEPDQILILSSSQAAMDLAARVLLDPGDTAWMEDPGYLGARGALRSAGARLVPVPVDEHGLDVAAGIRRAPRARLCYVTPSHQFPLGVTLSLERRLALLRWARRAGAWILEDDYDSEFRYDSRPLQALLGIDADGRVLYTGTFTKTMFPGLRLAYLVAPPDLIDVFLAARAFVDAHSPPLLQAALAEFLEAGHFAAHLRRTRALYAERQQDFQRLAAEILGDRIRFLASSAGMHLTGLLPPGNDDLALQRAAARAGVDLRPLSRYFLRRPRAGLVFGYACCSTLRAHTALQALAACWPKAAP